MAMKVVWAAVLLAYGVSTGAAKDPIRPGTSNSALLPLDMAPDSVDDMYNGCNDSMAKKVEDYLQNEKNTDSLFKKVWEAAEEWYREKHKKSKRRKEQKEQKEQRERLTAIYAYTFIEGDIYKPFNKAVRTQGPHYKTDFRFHALHFHLTMAVQKLNYKRGLNLAEREDRCLTVHRRVDEYFSQDVVNTQVRLGSFASSTLGPLETSTSAKFGDKSCFEIVTCMGADVSMHSKYENEAEVLIPPYEVFKVRGIKKRSEQPDLKCDVVYNLTSTEQPLSNLNCALFQK